MKRAMAVVLLAALLAGCELLGRAPPGWDYPGFPHPERFASAAEVTAWTSANISGVLLGRWQDPAETYADRAGDCKGFSLLAMYFMHEAGIATSLVILTVPDGQHAVLRVLSTGQLMDAQMPDGHLWLQGKVLSEMSYEDALWVAVTHDGDPG